MKKPNDDRWMDSKELSYLISWGCIVLASAMLFPIVVMSTTAPMPAKVAVGIVLVVLFVLGVYSLVIDIIDYFRSKKMDDSNAEEK